MTTEYSFVDNLFNPGTLAGTIFYAFLFFLLALLASFMIRKLVHRIISRAGSRPVDRTAFTFISQLLQVAMFIIASILYFYLIPSLRAVGSAILATAGVASIVIGLAAQNTLGNIISGISILLYRPVRLGDEIKVYASAGDESGVVETITLGYTILITPDGDKIIIPNSVLASTVIVNHGNQETMKSGSTKK